MSPKRLLLVIAGLLVLSLLAACAPLPPATQAPGSRASVPAAPSAPVTPSAPVAIEPPTTPTTAASPTLAPSPTPVASPTPAIPDPKADPAGALLYAASGKLFKTAEFTYTMGMTMKPADEASAKALGAQAEALKTLQLSANGQGAMEVTDPAALKSKMRMDMAISGANQNLKMQMVVIDQTAWMKISGQEQWQKMEGQQVSAVAPGVSPETMLQDFKKAVDVQWVEDETLAGEQVSHLRFSMDPSKIDLASIVGNAAATAQLTPEEAQNMFKDFTPVVDVWLSKDSLELRGEEMQLRWIMPLPKEGSNAAEARLAVNMIMDMRFTKVNEPVTINPPTE